MATRFTKSLNRKIARMERQADARGVKPLWPVIAFMERQGHAREWPRSPRTPDRAEFDAALSRILGGLTTCITPPEGRSLQEQLSDLAYLLSATLGTQPGDGGDECPHYTYTFDPVSWLMRPGYPTITDALAGP